MGQLNPLNNMLANPLVSNLDVHFDVSRNLLKTAQELNATEGYIFKNLEKDGKQSQMKSLILVHPFYGDKKCCGSLVVFISADYPYINYYVINKSREEAGHFYTHNKLASHDGLNAAKLGYTLVHSMDLYDEVSPGALNSLRAEEICSGRHDCSASSGPGAQEADHGLHRLHHLYLPGLQGRRRREV